MHAIAPGGSARIWSTYQEAIFDAVVNGSGNLVVIAGPGSGKTTTSVEAFSRSQADRVLFAAFGKETAQTLAARLPSDIQVRTWHGFGMRCIGRAVGKITLNDRLKWDAAAQLVGKGKRHKPARSFVVALLGAAKATLSDPSELDALADTWGIDCPASCHRPTLVGKTAQLLEAQLADLPSQITYDDMPWLPVVHDLEIPPYDLIGVDEAQDLNPCQLELACRAGREGRIVVVGDPHQSIYTWRGADPQAMPRMRDRLSASTLPLTVCYRCGTDIVAEAVKVWPGIESPPDMHRGIVRSTGFDELSTRAQPGDFVISRLNAPLVSLAMHWLASGKRCRILGRDFARGLASWIEDIGASSVQGLLRAVDDYERREVARLEELDRDTQQVTDRCTAVRALSEGLELTSEVLNRLERLVTDDPQHGMIHLASTHRAKGLEAPRVWLLRDTYCRRWVARGRAVHDPQRSNVEERNLFYVGITRAQNELIYVDGVT